MPVRFGATVCRVAALIALLLVFGFVACAGSDDARSFYVTQEESSEDSATTGMSVEESSRDDFGRDGADTPNAPTAIPRPAATTAPAMASAEKASQAVALSGSSGFFQGAPLTDEAQASVLPQNRVIVRTVDMGIIVPDVPQSTDEIIAMARRHGGWQVSAERSRKHQAALSVRVPAGTLDEFVLAIREMSDRVEFETSTSRDVTDEYIDNEARLKGLRATETRLLEFLSQAVNVEEALNVQAELARIQFEIEAVQGRLRFLSQTAAFSLVNLSLTTKPGEMPVEIGPDAAIYRAGLGSTFRATFQPPDGVDEFTFTWDFGDGTEPVKGSRTAPTTDPGERVTSTVSHTFLDVEQSPYIVQLNISGIGDTGLYQGSDTLIATVTEIAGIEVFAGEGRVVDEGDEVEYGGSFTRPEALWDFNYRWDFGDGTATVFDVPPEGETRAVARHTFRDYRPDPYQVVLTVTAQSEAGEVKGTSYFFVEVNEVEGFVVGGWDVGGTAKSAVRALTVVGSVLLTVLIWVGILSPVWLAALAAVILFNRLRRRFWPYRYEWSMSRRRRGEASSRDSGVGQGIGPDEPSATYQSTGQSSPSALSDEEQPTRVCGQCGRDIPAVDTQGNPSRYCPFCGAENQPPEN